MFVRASSFLAFAFVAALAVACSSSTTETSAATVAGVCGKMNGLTCGKANCVEVMELAQKRCPEKTFQAFLDCAAVSEMRCETQNGNDVAVVASCAADLSRVNACAGSVSQVDDRPNAAPAPTSSSASATSCTPGDGTCPTWSCMCKDGELVKVSSCVANRCATPVAACAKGNAELEALCATHGGT